MANGMDTQMYPGSQKTCNDLLRTCDGEPHENTARAIIVVGSQHGLSHYTMQNTEDAKACPLPVSIVQGHVSVADGLDNLLMQWTSSRSCRHHDTKMLIVLTLTDNDIC
jgi:hypothetical protein